MDQLPSLQTWPAIHGNHCYRSTRPFHGPLSPFQAASSSETSPAIPLVAESHPLPKKQPEVTIKASHNHPFLYSFSIVVIHNHHPWPEKMLEGHRRLCPLSAPPVSPLGLVSLFHLLNQLSPLHHYYPNALSAARPRPFHHHRLLHLASLRP